MSTANKSNATKKKVWPLVIVALPILLLIAGHFVHRAPAVSATDPLVYHMTGGYISFADWHSGNVKYAYGDQKVFCTPRYLLTYLQEPQIIASTYHGWHKSSGMVANAAEVQLAQSDYAAACTTP